MQFGQFDEIIQWLIYSPQAGGPKVEKYFETAGSSLNKLMEVCLHAYDIRQQLPTTLRVTTDWQCPCANNGEEHCEADRHCLQTTATTVDLKFPHCPPSSTLRMTLDPFPLGDDEG